ncbi:hypothetical protein HPB50_027008 [Hyalomma asiaticum]|uniref:Uncharacterized protein n=1 Tax=Hyalomma asiaticum TaxID=266040 RepID=A0ACB7SI85_HYAAI|nr:hypothetical protein HPB50_027008 [Hyalomma asiaticum]
MAAGVLVRWRHGRRRRLERGDHFARVRGRLARRLAGRLAPLLRLAARRAGQGAHYLGVVQLRVGHHAHEETAPVAQAVLLPLQHEHLVRRLFGYLGLLRNGSNGTDTTMAVAVVTDRKGKITACAFIDPATTTAAKVVTITLAVKEGWTRIVPLQSQTVTDSHKACRNYLEGQIGALAHRILIGNGWDPMVKYIQTVTWAPGHEGVTGNMHADEAARGFTNHHAAQDAAMEDPTPLDPRQATILNYYRYDRTLHPPPNSKLNVAEAIPLRRLRTDTNFHALHLFYTTESSRYLSVRYKLLTS